MKKPWMKFYPSDWRADEALRSCSIAARGLWVEMMALMHVADPYGSLLVKGKRPDKKQLASLAGISEKDCISLLMELEGMAVFARDEDGTIYSRRMRRDAEKALVDKSNGKMGGNPKVKEGVNPPDNGGVKAHIPDATARVDTMVEARARESKFTDGSKALASAFWKALGFASPLSIPPEFAGVDWRAIDWEAAGWTVDLIEMEARRIGPDKPLSYHEKVFATAFAKRQAPLPTVQIRQADPIQVTHGTSQNRSGGSLISAIDRELAALEAEERADLAVSESPVLRIPN